MPKESIYLGANITFFYLSGNENELPGVKEFKRKWDLVTINRISTRYSFPFSSDSFTFKESGPMLTVVPSLCIGTLLDNKTFKISSALCIGCDLCIFSVSLFVVIKSTKTWFMVYAAKKVRVVDLTAAKSIILYNIRMICFITFG